MAEVGFWGAHDSCIRRTITPRLKMSFPPAPVLISRILGMLGYRMLRNDIGDSAVCIASSDNPATCPNNRSIYGVECRSLRKVNSDSQVV